VTRNLRLATGDRLQNRLELAREDAPGGLIDSVNFKQHRMMR
jgi:hypothetical protein